MKATDTPFQGYSSPNYTPVPDELFDDQLADLSGAELKVLLYIIRRTFGFKKDSDSISLNQICNGITTREGETIDRGTGLSLSTVQQAIKGLIQKLCVIAVRNRSQEKGDMPTTYSLNIRSSQPPTDNQQGGIPEIGNGGYRKSVTQETTKQETDIQLRNSKASSQQGNQEPAIGEDPPHRGKSTPTSLADIMAKHKPNLEDLMPKQKPTPQILAAVTEISSDLGDIAHLRSNTTQAVNIWQQSGKSEPAFVSSLYEARSITRQQKKVRHPMPYFWSTVRDLVGLRNELARAEG